MELRLKAWDLVLQLGGLGRHDALNEMIQPSMFNNANENLATMVIQLCSMETFLFDALN